MKYCWIDTELLQKSGVTKDLQAEWNWIRYHIGGKMFAAVCLDDATGKPVYITCKLDPAEGDFLRRQYEDIIPGYYMNKVHWNSVKAEGNVPDAVAAGEFPSGEISEPDENGLAVALVAGKLPLAVDAPITFRFAEPCAA